jgi:hypothetical protein
LQGPKRRDEDRKTAVSASIHFIFGSPSCRPHYDAPIVSVTISLGSSGRANCKAFNALNEPSLHVTGCGRSTAGVILAVAKKGEFHILCTKSHFNVTSENGPTNSAGI